ncbi:protein FAM200A-like [Andrena cerasifolii]|uniref:protein FAM200A-like n=1 Tax=Andrena cerasifolii TaxID=2819439 RepID=UPI00403770DB
MSKESGIDTSVAGPSCIAIKTSDIENESSSDNVFPLAKKSRKSRRQAFRQAWLEDPDFKPWLRQCEDPYKAECIVCCKTFVGGKSELQKHQQRKKHSINMQYRKEGIPLEPIRNFTDSVKVSEIRFCINIIEHNRSFNSFKQLIQMPQVAPADPNIVRRMSLKRSKISAIIQNVLDKSVILETTDILHGKFFSILIDETTDISDTKLLWFLIRYVQEGQIHTYLLDSIRIKECTAENLHKCFLHSLNKYNLPVRNIVGVCVDNSNVMLGRQNSLISRLLADNEEISVFPCICHSMNLVTSHACKYLPPHVEEFLHSIYTYFSRNPKQQSPLEGMQDFISVANQKLLQPSRTRWLELSECVKRVLNQWPDLYTVFAEAVTEGKSKVASKIFRNFNCLYTKAYVQFLNYVLNIFIGINALFLSSKVLLHCLLPECLRLLRSLGGNFIKSEYIAAPNIHEIDVYNEANLVPTRTIFIGAEAMTTINEIINSTLDGDQHIEFYTNVKKFYQSAFENIAKRLPFNEPFLNSLVFLSPHIALDITKHQNDQLNCILSKFKSKFNCNNVLNEWRLLPFYFSREEKENLQLLSIPKFWHQISNTKDISGKYIFKNISKLAQLCLSLPHSNADVKRLFSTVTEIKTKERNRLKPQTIAALTRIKLDLDNKNANSLDYKITDNMLKLFNNNMYRKECIPEELAGILLPDDTDESDNETSDN